MICPLLVRPLLVRSTVYLISSIKSFRDIEVTILDHNRIEYEDLASLDTFERKVEVEEVQENEDYKPSTFQHDIALLVVMP